MTPYLETLISSVPTSNLFQLSIGPLKGFFCADIAPFNPASFVALGASDIQGHCQVCYVKQ